MHILEENTGVFELANEDVTGAQIPPYLERLRALALSSGRPVTFGVGSSRHAPDAWRTWIDAVERSAAEGGKMFAMVHARSFNVVLSFRTHLPFDGLDVWKPIRALPLEQQAAALRDPATRTRLLDGSLAIEENGSGLDDGHLHGCRGVGHVARTSRRSIAWA